MKSLSLAHILAVFGDSSLQNLILGVPPHTTLDDNSNLFDDVASASCATHFDDHATSPSRRRAIQALVRLIIGYSVRDR
jgi:hypothetical protein